jgi:hypothetical protein
MMAGRLEMTDQVEKNIGREAQEIIAERLQKEAEILRAKADLKVTNTKLVRAGLIKSIHDVMCW